MTTLGKNISTIRILSGMTQSEFAKFIIGEKGNKGMISSYEKAGINPSRVALGRIAKLGSVTVDDLMTRELDESDITIDKSDKSDIKVALWEPGRAQSEIIALKAAIKILILKIAELESQDVKKRVRKSFLKSEGEMAEAIQQEQKRILDELRMS